MSGLFFAFEGIDGAGKSTQIDLFCRWLKEAGYPVLGCQDPGTTPLGLKLRDLLLDANGPPIGRRSEMLLYMAARAQLVEQTIAPALAAGQVVVSDRFLLSNVVYQGYGGQLAVDQLWQIGQIATAGLLPSLSFVLDVDPAKATGRIARDLDRMEQEGLDFRSRIRAGYLAEAKRRPGRIKVIDGSQSIEAVHAVIRRLAEPLLEETTPGL